MTDSYDKPSETRVEARLAAMYPTLTQAKPAAPEPSPTILGGSDAAEQIAPERQMYDPVGMYGQSLQDGLNSVADHFGMTPEQTESAKRETSELFVDLEMSPTEARGFHDLYVTTLKYPADDEQIEQWTRESRRGLRERYGDEAGKRVAMVQQYIDRNPSLQKVLAGTGLGSHPDIVLGLAEKAYHLAGKVRRAG